MDIKLTARCIVCGCELTQQETYGHVSEPLCYLHFLKNDPTPMDLFTRKDIEWDRIDRDKKLKRWCRKVYPGYY